MDQPQDAVAPAQAEPEQAEVVTPSPQDDDADRAEAVHHPAKVMRIGTMVRQLLEEAKAAPLDEASRARLKDIYETSIRELGEVLSPELKDELARLSFPFNEEAPSDAELRIAHAQLVGWLEGLFHGIQAMLFAQQMETRAQLDELRRRGLPAPAEQPRGDRPPGTYL